MRCDAAGRSHQSLLQDLLVVTRRLRAALDRLDGQETAGLSAHASSHEGNGGPAAAPPPVETAEPANEPVGTTLTSLAQEHTEILDALRQKGFSMDGHLLPLIRETLEEVTATTAQLEAQRDRVLDVLASKESRKKTTLAYARATGTGYLPHSS